MSDDCYEFVSELLYSNNSEIEEQYKSVYTKIITPIEWIPLTMEISNSSVTFTAEEDVKAYDASMKEALEAIERGEYTELPLLGDSRRHKFESKEEVMKEMSEMVRKAIDQEIVNKIIQGNK